MEISYGDSTSGYGHATIAIGPRGGLRVTAHDGDPRRVTQAALVAAARLILDHEVNPAVVSTGGDYIPVWRS